MYYDCDTKKNRRTTTQHHEFSMFAERVLNWSQSIKKFAKAEGPQLFSPDYVEDSTHNPVNCLTFSFKDCVVLVPLSVSTISLSKVHIYIQSLTTTAMLFICQPINKLCMISQYCNFMRTNFNDVLLHTVSIWNSTCARMSLCAHVGLFKTIYCILPKYF